MLKGNKLGRSKSSEGSIPDSMGWKREGEVTDKAEEINLTAKENVKDKKTKTKKKNPKPKTLMPKFRILYCIAIQNIQNQ